MSLAECGWQGCATGLVATCLSVQMEPHQLISPHTLSVHVTVTNFYFDKCITGKLLSMIYRRWLAVTVQLRTKLGNIRTECACPY